MFVFGSFDYIDYLYSISIDSFGAFKLSHILTRFFTHVLSLSPSFSLFRYHPWSTLTFLHTYSLLCVAQHAVSFFIYTRSHAFLMFKITTARTGADCQNIQYTHAHVTFFCNSVCSAVYELLPDHQNHFPLLIELQRFIDAMSLHYEAPRPPRVSRCR